MSQRWMLITAAALPVSYAASRYAREQKLIQQAVVVGLWAAYLSSLERDPEAFFSQDTMIASVMVFILPLKLSQQILCYEGTESAQPIWRDFLGFVGSFFYYAVPISKSKNPPAGWTPVILRAAENLLVVAAKITLLPVMDAYSRHLVAEQPSYEITDVVYWKLLVVFAGSVVVGTFSMDLQCAAVHLLTGGHYEQLPMHNYPLFSTSVSELWARRYNRLINCLLKETVYVPLRKLNYSAAAASLAAFAVSGILHSWVAYYTFGGGIVRACIFFVVQVPWIVLEKQFEKYPAVLKRFLTIAFFFGTMPLYVGLFVEGMPQWLEKNDAQIPQVPGLMAASQWFMATLGIEPSFSVVT